MKSALLPFLFIVTVLVSGCTGILSFPQTISFGNGVEIIEFVPEIQSVYSGENIDFRLKLKNSGSFLVADGNVMGKIAKVGLNLGESEWNCKIVSPEGDDFTGLFPPSEERGTQGEEFTVVWACTAPQIGEGMKVPYTAFAEAEYSYRSVTSKLITILPTRELITLRDSGKSLPTDLKSKSNSPVSVDIQIEGPIRIRDDMGIVDFPVNIIIENNGGGLVKNSKVSLSVEGVGGVTDDDECDRPSLDLWKGMSQTITCRLKANNVEVLTQSTVEVQLEYIYVTGAETTIEVVGTKNSGYPI